MRIQYCRHAISMVALALMLAALAACRPAPASKATVLPAANPPPTAKGTDLTITVIDVGKGDAILVQAPGGAAALIDGGSDDGRALAYLQAAGITTLDVVILTHPHADHISGLDQVVRTLDVKKVFTNGQEDTTPYYNHFMTALTDAGIETGAVARGDTINLGGLALDVLHPGEKLSDNLNQNSIVLRLTYAGTTVLLEADATTASEAEMLNAGLDVKADILKVGHHGSCDSSSHKFLDAVNPAVAVYSTEKDEKGLLPCRAVLHALDERDIATFGTDVDGTIVLVINEEGYHLSNGLGQALK